jgi:predicted ATPase
LQELARRYARGGSELAGEVRLDQVLLERIARLEPTSRRLLEVSAVAGVPLPAHVLGRVARVARADLGPAVALLRSEQLVRLARTEGDHRLIEPYHDRIREAVVQAAESGSCPLASYGDLAEVHLELARDLLRARAQEGLAIATTTIANQYNLGAPAIRSPEDRIQAAGVALGAARQMRLASAYDAALRYIEGARGHLATVREDAATELYREADLLEMEVALLADQRHLAAVRFDRLVAESRDALELAKIYEARVVIETGKGEYDVAIATACEGLGRLSMRFPRKGKPLALLFEIARLEFRLLGRKPSSLTELPVVRQDRMRAQTQILMAMSPAAYFRDVPLMCTASVRMARMSLTGGLTDVSAYAFITYAVVLAGAFRRYGRAREFSLLAKALNERFQNRALDAKLLSIHAFFVGAYVTPLEELYSDLREAQRVGLASGDLNYRVYAATSIARFTLVVGSPLAQLKQDCIDAVRVVEETGTVDRSTAWTLRAIRCLQGENETPLRMDGDSSEEELLQQTANLTNANFDFGLMQLVLGYHFGDAPLAAKGAERAARYSHGQFGAVTLVCLCFYKTMAMCRELERSTGFVGRRKLRLAIRSELRKLAKWAEACEANYGGHFLLARGEFARVLGEKAAARRDLDAAATQARQRGNHNVAGLASERLAAWHAKHGTAGEARASLAAAITAYRSWGAEACVARLSAEERASRLP